jgi:hypothetical protein
MRDKNDLGLRLKSGDRIIGHDGLVTCIALRDIRADDPFDLEDFNWIRQTPSSQGSIPRDWGIGAHAGMLTAVTWMCEAAAIEAGLP